MPGFQTYITEDPKTDAVLLRIDNHGDNTVLVYSPEAAEAVAHQLYVAAQAVKAARR